MCTAITVQSPEGAVFFSRTMDFSYALDPELYLVPKGCQWRNILNTHTFSSAYRFMGIGQNLPPLVFADGVNEMGFAAAALYFPGYAQYDAIGSQNSAVPEIAAIELVKFLLSSCGSVKQAGSVLRTIRIVGVVDAVTNSVAPLHWILADKSGACMVVEKTADGLHLMDNPMGVLSNSPDLKWHLTNLRNYMNTSAHQQQEKAWGDMRLTPFGQGAGTFGLPGDFTPPSRFVRSAFQKSHTLISKNRDEAVVACFHILEGVSIPKGVVMTARATSDYTQYTACVNLSEKEYFFKTYDNSQVVGLKLPNQPHDSREIVSFGKLVKPIAFAHRTNL